MLFLTNGIPSAECLWSWQRACLDQRISRRHSEAQTAAAVAGYRIAGFANRPTRSLKDHLPAALADIRAAVNTTGADRLWIPAYEGGHQDHDAANLLGACLDAEIAVWEFAEYNFCGGKIMSHRFPQPHPDEQQLELTADETATKRRLLELYASERGNLSYVSCSHEVFRPLCFADYRRPPHPGRLFYQRFQWVPFRHPRIDFTTPDVVCARLAPFAAAHGLVAGGSAD
ncbi:PIG-L family deacetylase [Azospirillaceae bacterium]